MAAPGSSGWSSRLRVGGLALLGIGAVAGLIGLATLAVGNGNNGQPTAAPPPASTAPAAPSVSATPSVAPPVPTFAPTPTTAIAAPPTPAAPGAAAGDGTAPGGTDGTAGGQGAAGGTGSDGGGVARKPIRVYNNGTISGLAARAAQDFRNAGWPVEQVANYPSGTIPTSTVYYRPGTGEQASAKVMGDAFGLRVEPRFAGLSEASPGLIVIVTNDYKRR